jgi:mono/diheme cytochrome c family protein
VPGTEVHARGNFSGTSSGRAGTSDARQWYRDEVATNNPHRVTIDLLEHGRNRFNIYCAPCHSPLGDGDGFIVRRGFPAPPSYHIDRLRDAPDRHFFDVMTQGYGIMYSYADRLTPADRWAVVAYIRALQLSQHAHVAALNRGDVARVERASR